MLHRRTSSYGCPRGLARLMASCDSILEQQQHADQLVQAYSGRTVPRPFVVHLRRAEPNQDAVGASCSSALVPREGADTLDCASVPLPASSDEDESAAPPCTPRSLDPEAVGTESAMDTTPLLKRARDAADSSEDERVRDEEGGDDCSNARFGRAAIPRGTKRRGVLGEAATSLRHVTATHPVTAAGELYVTAATSQHPAASPIGAAGAAAVSAPPGVAQDGGARSVNTQQRGAPSTAPTTSGAATDDCEGPWTQQVSRSKRRKARRLAAGCPPPPTAQISIVFAS